MVAEPCSATLHQECSFSMVAGLCSVTTTTKESQCVTFLGTATDRKLAPGPNPDLQAHDSLLVGGIHSDMRHQTCNQGISVCNLLGFCDGSGAGSRAESRTPSTRFLDCGLGLRGRSEISPEATREGTPTGTPGTSFK